jgi:hypothetical protein
MIPRLDGRTTGPAGVPEQAPAPRERGLQVSATGPLAGDPLAPAEVLPGSVASERSFALAVILAALQGREGAEAGGAAPDVLRRAAAAMQQAAAQAVLPQASSDSSQSPATVLQKALALLQQASLVLEQGTVPEQTGGVIRSASSGLQQALAGAETSQPAPTPGSAAAVLREALDTLQRSLESTLAAGGRGPAEGQPQERGRAGPAAPPMAGEAFPIRDARAVLQHLAAALGDGAAALDASDAAATPEAALVALREAASALDEAAKALTPSAARGQQGAADGLQKAVAVLQEAARALLPPAAREALQQRLQPIPLDAPPAAIGQALRGLLENGGALFEAHLAALLAAQPAMTTEQLVAALGPDLRVLLGRLSGAAARLVQKNAPGAVEGEDPGPEASAALAREVSGSTQAVAGKVLEQQLLLAHDWIADTVLSFEFPVTLPGEERRALLRFGRDREAGGGEEAAQEAYRISLQLDSDELGAVNASAAWRGGACQVTVFVEREATRASLNAHRDSLRAGLGSVFTTLNIEVALDNGSVSR